MIPSRYPGSMVCESKNDALGTLLAVCVNAETDSTASRYETRRRDHVNSALFV